MQPDRYIWPLDGCSTVLLASSFLMSFSVRQIDGVDDDGNVTTVTHSLSPESVTLA